MKHWSFALIAFCLLLMLPTSCGTLLVFDKLTACFMSERVYPAPSDVIVPQHEGKMVRVRGKLTTPDVLEAGDLRVRAVDMQHFSRPLAHAQQLQLGCRKVEGLFSRRREPFGYYMHAPEAEQHITGDGSTLHYLPDGIHVELQGRQHGNVLDMADEHAAAALGNFREDCVALLLNRTHAIYADVPTCVAWGMLVLLHYTLWWVLIICCTHVRNEWADTNIKPPAIRLALLLGTLVPPALAALLHLYSL